jgi:predicted RNA-binding Zn-ribbon protein involved in translation (DUF1610 family)
MPYKNKEERNAWMNRYREKKRIFGICAYCSIISEPGHTLCKKHLMSHQNSDVGTKKKRFFQRRCISCGMKLEQEMDGDHVKCIFCRENILRGNMWRSCPENYRQITI